MRKKPLIAKAAKDTAIDEKFNNKELTETERDDAKKAAKQAADTAKEAIDAQQMLRESIRQKQRVYQK
ncbi:hypothetical protein H1220_01965 [Carnobacteriaceae bacterium zg-84]|nr:hypothetical protein H1220_01965 [Carnobacteriaceae bacterium zg-84]